MGRPKGRVAAAVVATGLVLGAAACSGTPAASAPSADATPTTRRPAFPRDLVPYHGLGAWVDAFDVSPAFQVDGAEPSLDPGAVDDMADRGVTTIYLQAARADVDAPDGLLEPEVLHAWLARAHERGLRVVGWYLPILEEPDKDLHRMLAVRDFEADGERFDGLLVDIEYTQGVPDATERSRRLVEWSNRLRVEVADTPLGAAVLTPPHLDVVNPAFWPGFPWGELGHVYDAWVPMAYWTGRSEEWDAHRYTVESVEGIRRHLAQPDALVAPAGGLAEDMSEGQVDAYVDAIVATGSVGGSIYDWNTLSPAKQAHVTRAFERTGLLGAGAEPPRRSSRPPDTAPVPTAPPADAGAGAEQAPSGPP